MLLVGGPAASGKSTLARAWCETRPRAVHLELDALRERILRPVADPQVETEEQTDQYKTSARATVALARAFLADNYDVVLDDTLPPDIFDALWRPLLDGIRWHVVVVVPTLEATLARSRARRKRVIERHIHTQHRASLGWMPERRIDTTGLDLAASVRLLIASIGERHLR